MQAVKLCQSRNYLKWFEDHLIPFALTGNKISRRTETGVERFTTTRKTKVLKVFAEQLKEFRLLVGFKKSDDDVVCGPDCEFGAVTNHPTTNAPSTNHPVFPLNQDDVRAGLLA